MADHPEADLRERLLALADLAEVSEDGDRIPGNDPTAQCVFVDMRPADFDALIRDAARVASLAPDLVVARAHRAQAVTERGRFEYALLVLAPSLYEQIRAEAYARPAVENDHREFAAWVASLGGGEAMREDTRRLDWLALHPRGAEIVIDGRSQPCVFWGVSAAPERTLREAIDAARLSDVGSQEAAGG